MNLSSFFKFIFDYKITEYNPCLLDNYGEQLPKIFLNISKYDKRHLKLISIYKRRLVCSLGIDFHAFKLLI